MNKLNNKNNITDKKAARQAKRENFFANVVAAYANAPATNSPYSYYVATRKYTEE
jgi:hypothetical protein